MNPELETLPKSKLVLDACCGSKMFWFDRNDPRALFVDKRSESHTLCDGRDLNIDPDVVADFTNLPFEDQKFHMVVFDPPHLHSLGKESWMAKKYGVLGENWEDTLQAGFVECFRVLKQHGVLIFKWNETDIKVSEILALSPVKPLFGNRSGKRSQSHWIAFIKP